MDMPCGRVLIGVKHPLNTADHSSEPGSGKSPPAENPAIGDAFPLWQRAGLFGIAYFVCAHLGGFLSVQNSSYVSFWLPAGLYVAVLLLHETRQWPGLMLAALGAGLAFDLSLGTPFVTALAFYAANTVAALTGAWLMRRFVARRPTLATLREFLWLAVYAAALAPMVGATVGAAAVTLSGMGHSYWQAWWIWWASNAMAILLVAPLVLVWCTPPSPEDKRRWARQPGRLLEAILLMAGLGGGVWYLMVWDQGLNAPYKSRLMLFVLWTGLRFGARGATAINLLLALLMGFLTVQYKTGLTPAQISSGDYVLVLQSFLVINALIGLIPAVTLAERDRTVMELRASEERFRTLATGTFEGVCLCEDGRILDANEPMLLMFGCRREEMIGRDVLELVSPEQREQAAECLHSGREIRNEYVLLRRDGSRFHAETQTRTSRAGERTIHLIALRDVTAQRALTTALEEQRQRLAGIVNSSSDGIITVDGDHRIVVFNPAAEQMFGCPAQDALGQPLARFIPALLPGQLAEPVPTAAGTASKEPFKQGRGQRADGGEFPLEMSLAQIPLGDQRLITVTCRDLTDRIRTEATRQRLEAQLRQAQKMEAVGTLAGGIAHDFNNILAAIIAYTELARLTAPENAALQENLRLLLKSSDRAANLVRQLLSFTQQQQHEHRRLPLAPIVTEALGQLRPVLPATVELHQELDPGAPEIHADAARIQQVIANLCLNAVEAMRNRTGRIHVTLDHLELDGTAPRPHVALRASSYVRLTIRDEGQGMDTATLKRVFEPFFTTKEPGKGTGLSLAVAHGIIKQHGGAITAESEPDRGTTFTVYLPPARTDGGSGPTASPRA
jgi:PAS domain S-box-containing protein